MDFKKCSEVYGYKSIAEVEEEEILSRNGRQKHEKNMVKDTDK